MREGFKNWKMPNIKEGELTKWNWMVQGKKDLSLGKKTDIGAFTYIDAQRGVVIEEDVQIGSHCSIYSVSTIDGKKGKVVLKKNCKIGSHSTILPNVTIGENSVVGAYSLVKKDIPANAIAWGVPAKIINSSSPLEDERIPLFKIYHDEEDLVAVKKVIERGSSWAVGPEIKEFEEQIKRYVGREYAISFNSGTSALYALLLAYKIKKGDEVIVPSFTFISTANSPLFVGATPVFAEIERETYGLSFEDVKNKISRKTKAILLVHYAGCSARDTERVRDLARERNLLLIEDAAEALGAEINGRKVGTYGNSAMFSFCQNKVITTGEGGMIVTDSENLATKLMLIRSHGRPESCDYFERAQGMEYMSLGQNFRMPSMEAALGISQLKKIDKIINMRREKANYYDSHLSNIEEINLPSPPKDFFHVYQMYTIQLKDRKTRDALMEYLANKNISTKIYFEPIHLTQFYQRLDSVNKKNLPITEEISGIVLSLPIYPSITEREMDYVIKNIKDFFKDERFV